MKSFLICFIALFACAAGNFLEPNETRRNFNCELKLKSNIFHFSAVPLFRIDATDFEDDKIVGGQPTTIQEHPHQVSLRIRGTHECGGSIIAPTRVLTAAHCLTPNAPPSIYTVLAGTANRTDVGNGQLRNVIRFVIHPRYSSLTTVNDIAVLQTQTAFVFGRNVRAIAIPPQGAPTPDGASVVVTGWGHLQWGQSTPFPIILRGVSKPVVSNERCRVAYPGRITPDML